MPHYPAPAKLNLFLHVVGRRADGYHLLQTAFRLLDHGDGLDIEPRTDGRIVRAAPLSGAPLAGVAEADDLTVRAARALQPYAAAGAGVTIRLDKRLPQGGGLGGGSSDAATVLLALNQLWELDLPRATLQSIALTLGADVPVFVFGQTAFAEGVGERLQALTVPPAWYVVLTPPVAVPTAEIFAAAELTRDTPVLRMPGFSAGLDGLTDPYALRNDLEMVARVRYPVVAQHLDWLARYGQARMTGSGACVFAGFGHETEARAVFDKRPAGMQGFVAQGLDRHPLYALCRD